MKSGILNILWTSIYLRGFGVFLGLREVLLKQHRLVDKFNSGVSPQSQTDQNPVPNQTKLTEPPESSIFPG